MSLGIGGGYGQSSSKSKTKNIPYVPFSIPFFQDTLFPYTEQLFSNFADTNGVQGGPLRSDADSQVSQELSGYYTDPSTNRTLQPTVDAIERNESQYLDKALSRVNQGAAANNTLLSTKTAQILANTARKSAQDVDDRLTPLYANNYAQERARQAAAVPEAYEASDYDLKRLLEFINMFRAGGVTRQKGSADQWSVSGSGSVSA